MRFPKMCYVRPAKAQTSLGMHRLIRAFASRLIYRQVQTLRHKSLSSGTLWSLSESW